MANALLSLLCHPGCAFVTATGGRYVPLRVFMPEIQVSHTPLPVQDSSDSPSTLFHAHPSRPSPLFPPALPPTHTFAHSILSTLYSVLCPLSSSSSSSLSTLFPFHPSTFTSHRTEGPSFASSLHLTHSLYLLRLPSANIRGRHSPPRSPQAKLRLHYLTHPSRRREKEGSFQPCLPGSRTACTQPQSVDRCLRPLLRPLAALSLTLAGHGRGVAALDKPTRDCSSVPAIQHALGRWGLPLSTSSSTFLRDVVNGLGRTVINSIAPSC